MTTPSITNQTIEGYAQLLNDFHAKIKDEKNCFLVHHFPIILWASVFTVTVLVLSILAIKGTIATPGGIYWRLGIAGTVYTAITFFAGCGLSVFSYKKFKNYYILKKIETLLKSIEFKKTSEFTFHDRWSPAGPWPQELTLQIFSHLDMKGLIDVARVSKEWHQLAYDQSLWEKVVPQLNDSRLRAQIVSNPHLLLPQIRKLPSKKSEIDKLLEGFDDNSACKVKALQIKADFQKFLT